MDFLYMVIEHEGGIPFLFSNLCFHILEVPVFQTLSEDTTSTHKNQALVFFRFVTVCRADYVCAVLNVTFLP